MSRRGRLHHLELWMDDAAGTGGPWPWLLQRLGYTVASTWATGRSWVNGDAYIVLESGPAHARGRQERLRSGMNHLALWAGTRDELDALVVDACEHGWALMFADEHPHAGGPETYAAYLEDASGFEVELVAEDARRLGGAGAALAQLRSALAVRAVSSGQVLSRWRTRSQ